MTQLYQDNLAQLYDAAVPDWPGEIDFYRNLAQEDVDEHHSILEIASGTGRVAIKLAQAGFQVVGIDLSQDMLSIARAKSASLKNVTFVQADMRSFDLNRDFALALVPAYSFQLLLTEKAQKTCLEKISKHLIPRARLVLHLERQDPDWLASLPSDSYTPFEASGETTHPHTSQLIR
ncbi:class I SAM-dependent methyltransferase, partial [Candidatus Bipolaricaulota bacterium]|nr:class I SAM-dependent methyltransferase [Candidatus Bipolaricaulota bacterium]